MRIDDFKSLASSSGGFAVPNLYRVTLPPIDGASIPSRDLNLICKSVSIPGRQVTSQDFAIGTVNRKYANGYLVSDLTLTFHVMNNHGATKYFQAWQKLAHNQETYEVGYYKDYAGDKTVIIEQLQKGTGFSLFKKQLGFLDGLPTSLKQRLPDLGFVDLAQGEVDISIGSDAKSVRKVKLLEVYPTTVNDIQLGDDQNNSVTELSVQLSFKDWESEQSDSPNGNLADAIIGGLIGTFS